MKCLFCNGHVNESSTSYTVNRKGYHLYIEKIPAYRCTQCGEIFFNEKETKAIQDVIKTFERKLVQLVAA